MTNDTNDTNDTTWVDSWLVKYNNISCWCVWMENTCCEVLWISFFCSWNGRERVRENGWKSIFSGFIGQTSEAVELFFVLELCCDRAVAYQWVQLVGADFLLGMSKNLTKTGWRGNGNRDKSLVSSDLIRMQCGKKMVNLCRKLAAFRQKNQANLMFCARFPLSLQKKSKIYGKK